MGDDPPYLAVSTEVSAKYKGAFCEAKIRKVVRIVKCKVTFKGGLGNSLVSDDQIKGTLRVGATVEVKHPEKNTFVEAIVNKIQDCSQYTVVFDDGDITTLRRSALCLKSGRHFNESETLDQLPLTHPEHFSNPVVGGRRGVRRRNINADNDKDDSSDEEDIPTKKGRKGNRKEADMGKVVFVESTDKKKTKDNWFPALIVNPSAQETVKIRTKDDYLVRSFRDGRYYTVPKKETKDFKDSVDKYEYNTNPLRLAVEKATNYLEKDELPAHWDRDILFGNINAEESNISDEEQHSDSESSEDDPTEDKDRFVAQLYKFMDDRGTPINKVPLVCNKDLDLYKLYKIVKAHGGYNKVTNGSQWKAVTIKMGYGSMPTTSTINLVKQSYKKCVYHYEEFNRKLGVSMISRATPTTKSRSSRQFFREKHASGSAKDFKKEKEEPEEVKKEEEKEKKSAVVAEVEVETQNSDSEIKKSEQSDESRRSRSRQESRSRTKEPEESPEKTPKASQKKKRASLKEKEKEPPPKEEPSSPVVAPKKGNRGKKKETEEVPEKSEHEEVLDHIGNNVLVEEGHKLLVYYGPQSEGKVTYEAKVLKCNLKAKTFLVHYTGWNTRYDEWIKRTRISENLTFKPDQGKPAQGRGPAGYAETTESESSSSTKVSTKSPKRKPRPVITASTAASGTRSKSGITRRKRFSGESEIIKKRKTRQKSGSVVPIPSVSGSDAESSDSEDKLVPIVSTPPSSVSSASSSRVSNKIGSREKRTEDDDASSSSTSSSISKVAKDVGEKDKQNQVIDLKQIRSEMKGLDKMVKAPTSPSTSAKSTSPSGNELKLDIYDFQEDANDAPKLKMFAPRSPDKKEEIVNKPLLSDMDSNSKSVISDVSTSKEADKDKEVNNKTEAVNSAKSSPVAEPKDLKSDDSFNHEVERTEVAVVSPDISPNIINEPVKKTTVLPPVPETKPVAVGAAPATNVSKAKSVTVSQPTHVLKVVKTPSEAKPRATAPSPNKRSPVVPVDVAHPPPPPLVRSSTTTVPPKVVIAVPVAQPRPPLLIQRPVAPLNSGSPTIRLAIAGQQEALIRPPVKVDAIIIPSEPNNVTIKPVETKILPSATKQPDLLPHVNQQSNTLLSTPSSSSVMSSQTVTPVAEMKGIVPPPTKVPSLVQIQQSSSDIPVKLSAVTPKTVVKEKKSVSETKSSTTAPPPIAASVNASSATPMTTPKKKTKKIISKKFVESESDSSTEAESPKRVTKKRQRSETPKKSPPAKKKKLEILGKSPPVKRFTPKEPKNKISNAKTPDTQVVSSEVEKTPKQGVSIQQMTESVVKQKLETEEKQEKSMGMEIIDAVRQEKPVDKPEKELTGKQEQYFDKKSFDKREQDKSVDIVPKSLDNNEKSIQDKVSPDVVIGRETVLKSTKGQDKNLEVIDKSNEREVKLEAVDKSFEKSLDKVDKSFEKPPEKKERSSEKNTEKKEKEKPSDKPMEKREKNVDRSFDKPDRQTEKQEKVIEKKEKNLDKKDRHLEKKDKNVEKEKGLDKKDVVESEKKVEIREKGAEKLKPIEKKEKLVKEKEKSLEKLEKLEKNADRKAKSLEKIDKLLETPEKTSQKHDKQVMKPGKSPKKVHKLEKEKPSKVSIQKPIKSEKVSKPMQKQVKNMERIQEKQLKKLEEKQIDKAAKLLEKQVKDLEKPVERLEKEDTKEEVNKDIKSVVEDYKAPETKVVAETLPVNQLLETVTVESPAPAVKTSKSNASKKEEAAKSVHPLTTTCTVNLGDSIKSVDNKATVLPTISVKIPSKVMSLNLPELTNKSELVSSTIVFASKIEDLKPEKQEEPEVLYTSPISPMTVSKEEMSISLTTDEVIAKSPEPGDEIEEATNARLKPQKLDTPVQEDFPSNLLLCEEIIPGSPPGDNTSRFSFDDDANECTLQKETPTKVYNVSKTETKHKEDILDDIPMSNFLEEASLPTPSQSVINDVVKIQEKPPAVLEQNENDDFSKPSIADQNIFNPRQDVQMSMDTTPPLTPDSSSISSGSPRNEMGRGSPRADRDSSKSKESSDGDVDSAECLKNSDHAEESSVSSDMGRKTLKVSLPTSGTSGNSRKTRSAESRGPRNVSPPAKRRRIVRRKSPEEVVRSYPYRGRASSGRRPQSGTSNDNQDHHKTMPPPPTINVGRPPRSSRFTNFIPELDDSMDSEQRVGLITQAIQDLRERYVAVKSEMTSFERRRKRWKRREREKAERVSRQDVRMNT